MLKLNVGFNKKVGEANYGSKGACVGLELEIDSGIIGEPDRLRERIKQLFVIAKTSVEEELHGTSHAANGRNGAATTGNGHANGYRNGRQRDATRRATASQARALNLIADRQGVNLAELLRQRFGVDQAGDLSITEASALIDELKEQTDGNWAGGRR